MVYCSGSLGIDPKTGSFVPGDALDRTVREVKISILIRNVQLIFTVQALRNLDQVLEVAKSDLTKAVKVTIFISNIDHYAKVNKEHTKDQAKPCRTCVAVAKLPLEK
ncbi:hypothetical protein N7532_011373 [Penicillium argentinense]|uniref:Uncharacterized protein n=1 Tax=Penicillium argentinense TaxID=1131581 RepID=A0A9W9EII2_9EURO|nr:uncharacterized protein N7532_011373 [Penicillium argentinense]KAJ5082330.1 hypothetical protein N7532_011373 [Penicillium argentinense]